VELVAVVGRDLGVVCAVREARRAAVVNVARLVDLEERLGLVALLSDATAAEKARPFAGADGREGSIVRAVVVISSLPV